MQAYPEKSRTGFRFIYEDEDLNPFQPLTARYRVHDASTNQEMVGWTDATIDVVLGVNGKVVASSSDVVIPASANVIIQSSSYESRVLTVQSDYDTDNQLSQYREYRIENLSGFS